MVQSYTLDPFHRLTLSQKDQENLQFKENSHSIRISLANVKTAFQIKTWILAQRIGILKVKRIEFVHSDINSISLVRNGWMFTHR